MIEHDEREDHGEELAARFNQAVTRTYREGNVSTRGVLVASIAMLEAYLGQIPNAADRAEYLEDAITYLRSKIIPRN